MFLIRAQSLAGEGGSQLPEASLCNNSAKFGPMFPDQRSGVNGQVREITNSLGCPLVSCSSMQGAGGRMGSVRNPVLLTMRHILKRGFIERLVTKCS